MTDDRLPLAELLAKTGDADFLRAAAEAVVQLIMEADVEGQIGAGRHELRHLCVRCAPSRESDKARQQARNQLSHS